MTLTEAAEDARLLRMIYKNNQKINRITMKTLIYIIIIILIPVMMQAQYTGGAGRGDASFSLYNTHLPVIKINEKLPQKYGLHQNFPNPFNPETKIKFELSQTDNGKQNTVTKLVIYDISGKEVKILVNETLPPGFYEVDFNGSMLSSGVYFYKLTSGEYAESKKMILMK